MTSTLATKQIAQPLLKSQKKAPSQLLKDQESGKSIMEQFPKPEIKQFLNIGDNSIYSDSQVHVDEPLFTPEPHVIQFTNYEPLQMREQTLKLRNKDKVARSVKIIPPDSKLFQVIPCKKNKDKNMPLSNDSQLNKPNDVDNMSCRVAPGMEISYQIKFSPEAKIDYSYDLMIVTEREKFVVPIRAVGCRSMLEFPDSLDFGLVPVKHVAEKPVMVRNIGEKATKWHVKVPDGFKVNKTEGILEVNQSEQLVFQFIPQESRPYKDEVYLKYDHLEASIEIRGESHNDNVYLSKQHIHMEPTSITLYSHQYFQIVNKSSVPVEFSWRAFATEREENEKKQRLNQQLSQEEAEERMILEESNLEESMAESLDSDDSYDEDELNKKQERTQQKAIATLSRKYQSIRKAVEEDQMLFQDEIFSIEPLQGKIWPNTEITCCVTFKPQGPYHYSCTAFANITCSEERLPLNMTGQGKGPQASLSITEMDIGDIFVNFENKINVTIENTGEIDCHYKLIPYETPFGSKFHFVKTEGILGIKENVRDLLQIVFNSDILGEFSETFRFALEGSSEMLTLTFKGHVVAPTFKFSEEIIDFGKVSYKFPISKTVHLTNTSDVKINYVIRVPGDGRSLQTEFNITNDRGMLEKNREAAIVIEFIPCFPQIYDMVLVVDLEGVGQDMLAVPIKAECIVPKVRINPSDFLDYGQCFLRHATEMKIEIINEDTLRAKYEILPQDDSSKRVAIYQADLESGVIQPRQQAHIVKIQLKTEIISPIRVPLYIKVEGYHIPFMVTILANSIGPIVHPDKEEIDYGNVDVLKDYTEKVTIRNDSDIPAEYTAFTKNKDSIWKVLERHGILQPKQSKEINVICHADEVQRFVDTLHIIVNNGVDMEVQLKAKGCGSTLFCEKSLQIVDFKTKYTHQNGEEIFFLQNRGRKPQKITWVRTTKYDKNAAKKKEEEKKSLEASSKKVTADVTNVSGTGAVDKVEKEKEEEVKFVYAVVPDTITLQPKMGINVSFRANSFNVGKVIETWQCSSVVGGERKPKVVFNTTVQGEFIVPQLVFSDPKLYFKYLWEKGVPSMPITKALEILNGGPLPTTITIKIDPPYSCAVERLSLEPAKAETIKIDFDPGIQQNRLSDTISGKLNISHANHPQKDQVVLFGEVCFPNLDIKPPNIDFGCILNDTSKKKYLTLTNTSEMAANYEWSFLEEEVTSLNQREEEKGGKKKSNLKKKKLLPINEVFDILPVSGILLPGQTENVEFTYYSGNGLTYSGIAVCSVDGGPDYEVPIVGESSFVAHELPIKEIDFGEIPYNESSQKEFIIKNNGKVPFEFNINLSTVQRAGLIECSPMVGKVISSEAFKVIVKFFPGIPDNIDEFFLVEVAHFQAIRFKVKAVGIYPGCLLSFLRSEDELFFKRYEETKKMLNKNRINYSALFNANEAIKQMPPIPSKDIKDKSLIKEPFVMEIEAEADRRNLCEKILQQIEIRQAKKAMELTQTLLSGGGAVGMAIAEKGAIPGSTTATKEKKIIPNKKITNLKSSQGFDETKSLGQTGGFNAYGVALENICIASYSCDFGNVVVGSTKRKTFRLTNVGKIPVTFNFDKKILGQAGINIEPDKATKILPNSSIQYNVIYTTRKTAKFGKTKHIVPIDVKYGPSYQIEFIANLTIPELSMSTDNMDFQKVCVGTRKTVKVRFENVKEVQCEWWYYYKPDVAQAAALAKEGERFTVSPLNGILLPGQKQTVDIMFIPNSDKPFTQKLIFKCKDNNKQFILNAKGQGIYYTVEMVPDVVKLGPVLPYDKQSEAIIEMRNPMDQPIEIYSLDFDKSYQVEEDILKQIDTFSLPQYEPLFLPVRVPGMMFWSNIKKQVEKKKRMDDLKNAIKAADDSIIALYPPLTQGENNQGVLGAAVSEAQQQQQLQQLLAQPLSAENEVKKAELVKRKESLMQQLVEEENDVGEIIYPTKVKNKDKLNIILIGPEKCGKTTVANYLAQEHQRCVVKLDQIYDYAVKKGLPIADKARIHLEEEQARMKVLIEAQEKRKKTKKLKKGEVEEPDVNPAHFQYIPMNLLIQMLADRLENEDCNAGVIFDNLVGPNWPDVQFALNLICETLPYQNIQLIMFQFQKDEDNNDICTNYRYAKRHMFGHSDKKDNLDMNQTQKQFDQTDSKAKVRVKKAPIVKGLRKNQKTELTPEEEMQLQKQQLEDKKKAELLAKRLKDEQEKELQRPKDYSKDEEEKYRKYYDTISDLFTSIHLRQMNQQEEEVKVSEQIEQQPQFNENGEEIKQEEQEVAPEIPRFGKRVMVDQFIHFDFKYLCENAKQQVPEPLWPDPDKEPLPAPVIHAIVKKPPNRNERQPITLFSIYTPIQKENSNEIELSKLPTRWTIPAKESKKIHIKFFSSKIGTYDQSLPFEILGSYKQFNISLNAICEFPTINSNFRNVFMANKKSRPSQPPDSYMQKTYIVNENMFEFGPLLIGKNPEKRHDDEVMKKVNSSVFQITNNGKYEVNATFTLRSSLPVEEGGVGEKSPFILEPDHMTLKIDETKILTAYGFPDKAQLFKDEIICLLKDNPNPVIFPIQCLGAKPVVEIAQDIIEFDRLLLNKTLDKTLTIKNVCPIPIKWKLNGVETLPQEFQISKKEGTLKPFTNEVIEIKFTAKVQQKFDQKIVLEVEDTEGFNIKQDNKTIQLKAEAFDISLDIKMSHDQILDFDAVRVGEPKENTIHIKNKGMYPVKYNFTMKNKLTREIFTVEPMEGELNPTEEKVIKVKFMSQKEKKLKTSKNTCDIILNILEGKTQEINNSIPININVNAVYSKYSIVPLKNINFGPMQYGEQVPRTFEIRNEGLFDFKFAICDNKDEDKKAKIKEERQKEIDDRIKGLEEKEEEKKVVGKGAPKKPEVKAPVKKDNKKGAEVIPEGGLLEVSQYSISPATGLIAPGSSAIINVVFKAVGAKFYESTLAIDISNRDPQDQPEGIPFDLSAESSIPGINTEDLDQIFEEQTVIPSLDPSINTQTVITSSLFSIQERVFWFGTLIASKNPEGAREKIKIMNPNKIPCTVKFAIKPRTQSKSEGCQFTIQQPDTLTIEPHKHKYVTVIFTPLNMMQYGGIFEAIVQNGDQNSKTGKLVFELRGEGTLPTLQIQEPKEFDTSGTPILRFKKTRIGKDSTLAIILKNEGSIAATARFDLIKNDTFNFLGNLNHTITPKTSQFFEIRFEPRDAKVEQTILTFSTLNNPYENQKVLIIGEGYVENVAFEGLPNNLTDECQLGDCIVNKPKSYSFSLLNNSEKSVKFRWNQGDKDEFKFYPAVGHIKAKQSKQIKVVFKSGKTVKYDKIDLMCETSVINQKPDPETGSSQYRDWDDTMKNIRMVRPSEYRFIMKERENEEKKRKEEAELAAAAALRKPGQKAPAQPKKNPKDEVKEEEIKIDMSEEANIELIETIQEPEFELVAASEKNIPLKTSVICDYAKYECKTKEVIFAPTLMYASRQFKFSIKNTSLITLHFNFKIVNSETGILDAGPYSIIPKKGTIAPGCDDFFIAKFSPMEVESDFERILSANIQNLSPDLQPLILEVKGVADRPIIHFELPPSDYKDKKAKDMTPIDKKYKIIEFESLGTNIKNTRRFMAVNPTSQGYEFEWEEIQDENKKEKPMFKCVTPKGVILSGKKYEMLFEYQPDIVGEHESYWIFKIPAENITQHFMVVGRVNEPNVLFEVGKIKFGPLLLDGKNRETVNIINQEDIPFSFNFSKDSVKGNPDYGDSLRINPMSGTVAAQGQIPIEILFQPNFELTYNYNLICNVKRKARPLVLNVKGEGYKIHHSVFADVNKVQVQSNEPYTFEYGDFFINEKKSKKILITNSGEFNFDYVWKRQVNKYVTITPETGTVQKGKEIEFELTYLPMAEHKLKKYKCQLQIVSGPKYDFLLNASARKPTIILSFMQYDFGQCFVMRQPMPKTIELEIQNLDNTAITIDTIFDKKQYLDLQLSPGQVLLPQDKLLVPIIFTPREIKKYSETLTFDFNGLYKIDVLVTGEGIPMQMELVSPDQAFLDFGIVSVNGDVTKIVPLVNKSKQPVTFSLIPSNDVSFKKAALTFIPDKEITLKPREQTQIEIRYNPKSRMPTFTNDLMLQIKDNEAKKLIAIQGVSYGIELKIMDEVIAFGGVVKGSRLTKLLQMSNFGDVKAEFTWDSKVYKKHFTITPEAGYVPPNSNLDLEVTFHPSAVDSDIRYNKVKCEIKGGEPLALTLMGKCIEQDNSSTKELDFVTVVRKQARQVATIQNTDDKEWSINPTIATESDACKGYFTGKQTLVVPVKGTAQYEILYIPKTMTKKENNVVQFHKGSLFFPLPNGTAQLYKLNGTANEPEVEQTIAESVVAKKAKFIIIPVKNWVKDTQRFKVSWIVDGVEDKTTFIRGANTIDVAGESQKDYKLNFLAYKAGQFKFTVYFKNETTGEYMFFKMDIKVTEPELIELIELLSPVRETIQKVITIDNPTDAEIVIPKTQFSITNEYIDIQPDTLKIPAKAERGFEINYRPLIVSQQECDLILKNPILGDFKYRLKLIGAPSTTQRSIAYKTALGSEQVQAFKFVHYLKKQTVYTMKIERLDDPKVTSDFKLEGVPNITAPLADSYKGIELSVNVKYEPFSIGDSRSILKLTSPEGIEYTCLLFGKSTAPQPQGPIKILAGGKTASSIEFKNPLNEKSEFIVQFDNPCFILSSKPPGLLDPGKPTKIDIKYEAKPDQNNTAIMKITTKGLPSWNYYLQGE